MNRSESPAIAAAKSRAQHLARRLKGLGVDVRHTQALEALAATEGFRDWNCYQAHLTKVSAPQRLSGQKILVSARPYSGKSHIARAWMAHRVQYGRVLWVNGWDVPDAPLQLEEAIGEAVLRVPLIYDGAGNFRAPFPGAWPDASVYFYLMPDSDVPRFNALGDAAYLGAVRSLIDLLTRIEPPTKWGGVVWDEMKLGSWAMQEFLDSISQTTSEHLSNVLVSIQTSMNGSSILQQIPALRRGRFEQLGFDNQNNPIYIPTSRTGFPLVDLALKVLLP